MNLISLSSIDSTNSEALRKLSSLEDMTVLWALEQTAGRGQRGNTWFTEPGQNLTFSVVVKRSVPAGKSHCLNYAISEAVRGFLASQGVPACVKWPNDVYVRRSKICGVLIENSLLGGTVDASVVGVGVNINQKEFPCLASATSLWHCTGREYELEPCLRDIVERFEQNLSCDSATLFESYSSHLFNKDVEARYRDVSSGVEFRGIIKGVDPSDGRLIVYDLDSLALRRYRLKEVNYII